MKPHRLSPFAAGAFCAIATLAQAQTFRPVSAPDRPIQANGFTVLPPGGNDWYVAVDSASSTVAFGKKDPEHARLRGSVFLAVTLVKARGDGIATPEALKAEVERSVRASGARYTLVSLSLEPYVDAGKASDCVRIATTSEERENPARPGETLLLSVSGKACRHPLSPTHYVQATLSERRPATSPPLVDDKLKAEVGRAIDGVAYGPVR